MQLNQLTFFRFVAAAIVIIFHHGYGSSLAGLAPGVLTAGPEMVSFFFVLSGFIMIVAYSSRPPIKKRTYWLARFARISPVYFFALFLSAYFSFGGELDEDWRSYLLSTTFLQSWFPPYPRSLNIPGWSLSTEAFFYAIFPFLLAYYRKVSATRIVGYSLLCWVVSQAILLYFINSKLYSPYPSVCHDLLYFFPLANVNAFLAGTAGGVVYVRYLQQRQFNPWFSAAMVIGALALICQALNHEKNLYYLVTLLGIHKIPEGAGILAPLYLLLILTLAVDRSWLQKILSWSPFIFLGEISYSMYILQHPANLIYKRYVAGYLWKTLHFTNSQVFYVYLAGLILFCAFTFTQLETPLRRFITDLPRRRASRAEAAIPAFPIPALEANYQESKGNK